MHLIPYQRRHQATPGYCPECFWHLLWSNTEPRNQPCPLDGWRQTIGRMEATWPPGPLPAPPPMLRDSFFSFKGKEYSELLLFPLGQKSWAHRDSQIQMWFSSALFWKRNKFAHYVIDPVEVSTSNIKKKKKKRASTIGKEGALKQGFADISDSPPLTKIHRPPLLGVECHAKDPKCQESWQEKPVRGLLWPRSH